MINTFTVGGYEFANRISGIHENSHFILALCSLSRFFFFAFRLTQVNDHGIKEDGTYLIISITCVSRECMLYRLNCFPSTRNTYWIFKQLDLYPKGTRSHDADTPLHAHMSPSSLLPLGVCWPLLSPPPHISFSTIFLSYVFDDYIC
jgi:hypothetical protein